jgi:hypothetical protein
VVANLVNLSRLLRGFAFWKPRTLGASVPEEALEIAPCDCLECVLEESAYQAPPYPHVRLLGHAAFRRRWRERDE